jgi:DNA invertase Pin-like site-specific DNA recombinase
MNQIYGYVRVSTADQNLDRQLASMREQGVPKGNIFPDKKSGKDFNRPEYKKMIKRLKKGDLLIIHSIDRLGRDYDEILEQWRLITKIKSVDIRVLDMPLLDTTTLKGLLGNFISDLVLQLLSFVAQYEREKILERTREGRIEAKKKGVKFGRPQAELPADFEEQARAWRRGDITFVELVEVSKVSDSTVKRKISEMGL